MPDETEPNSLRDKDQAHLLPKNPSLLIQVHTNEYQALMTRATYYTTLSSAVWPLIVLFLTLQAIVWNLLPAKEWRAPVVVWGSGLASQLVLWIWVYLLQDYYNIVLYVEKYLRPLIQDVVGTDGFWLYEPFLKQQRRIHPYSTWWEFSVPVGVFFALVAAASIRILSASFLPVWDYIGLASNIGPLLAIFLKCQAVRKTRHAWEAANPPFAGLRRI